MAADTQKTYTIGARQMWVYRVHTDAGFFDRAKDPAQIDGTLDDVGVTNDYERVWCKAVARRHMQQQAIQVAFEDYEEGREAWDAGDHENGIPNSDEPGTGAAPWEPVVEVEIDAQSVEMVSA